MKESHRRTLLKAVSYRIIGGLITLSVAYACTGEIASSVTIGVFDTLAKVGAFYLHERLWLNIDYGRSKEPEYHI